MPPDLDDFFHAKYPRDRLIPSTDIYDQRILQSGNLQKIQANFLRKTDN